MHKNNKNLISIILCIILIFTESSPALALTDIPVEGIVLKIESYSKEILSNLKSIMLIDASEIEQFKNNKNEKNIINSEMKRKNKDNKEKNEKDFKKREDKSINKFRQKIAIPKINYIKAINSKTNIITWEKIDGLSYEIEVDGNIVDVENNNAYIHINNTSKIKHSYRIRAKSQWGISNWSQKVTKKPYKSNNNINKKIISMEKNTKYNIDKEKYNVSEKRLTTRKDMTLGNISINKAYIAVSNVNETQTVSSTLKNEVAYPHLQTGVHVIGQDWFYSEYDDVIGAPGDTVDMIKLQLKNVPADMKIKYRAYVKDMGWQDWVYEGSEAGVQGSELQAIEVLLEGNSEGFSLEYQLYCFDFSNVELIAKEGETAGIINKSGSAFYAKLINDIEYRKEVIEKDTKWTIDESPYIIDGELIINQNTTLEIDQGVKVIFKKYAARINGIEVNGNLVISGTVDNPVLFSYSEDGELVSSDEYTYRGIQVKETGNMLGSYFNIEQSGSFNSHIYSRGIVDINNAFLNVVKNTERFSGGIILESFYNSTIKDSTITNCTTGINIRGKNGVNNITNNKINNNGTGISISIEDISSLAEVNISNNEQINENDYGIAIRNKNSNTSKIFISGNNIDSSKYSGIVFEGSEGSNVIFEKNNITNTNKNRSTDFAGPIFINLSKFNYSTADLFNNINSKDATLKNTLSGNNFDAILISGKIEDMVYLPRGYNHYLIDTYLEIPEESFLAIEPGNIINIRGSIYCYGTLSAEGKKDHNIVFTSVADPNYGISHASTTGYDVNRDNNFDSIFIYENGELQVANTKIMHGGVKFYEDDEHSSALIKCWGKASVINSEIGISLQDGIDCFGSLTCIGTKVFNCSSNGIYSSGEITIVNSIFTNNKYGINVYDTSDVKSLYCNTFTKNIEAAISGGVNKEVEASNNYWGSPYGPSVYQWNGTSYQWIGEGDKIVGEVNYNPYLAEEYFIDLGEEFNEYIDYIEYKDERHFGEEGINPATGNFSKSYEDLSCEFAGQTIKFIRTYNSLSDDESIFGKGWRFSFQGEINSYTNSKGITSKIVKLPDGKVLSFKINDDESYTALDSRNKLVKNPDFTHTLMTKDQYKYNFNTSGKLETIVDRNGNTIKLSFTADEKIFLVSDGTGRTFVINYENGLVESITETMGTKVGRIVKYTYENNRLKTATDVAGNITIYDYDDQGKLSSVNDVYNNELECIKYYEEGDFQGLIKEHKDIYGNIHTYLYDKDNNRTTITDSNNKVTEYWYDNDKFSTLIVYPDKSTEITKYYLHEGTNKYGEEQKVIDRNSFVKEYERDDRGNIIKEINHDNSHKDFVYDDENNLIKEIDENGNKSFYIYDDEKKNLIKKANPLDGVMEYSQGADQTKFAITSYTYYSEVENEALGYKVKGLVKEVKDANGNYNSYTYDGNGYLNTEKDQEGNITTHNYNDFGFETSKTTPLGFKTEYYYDNNGNIVKIIENNGETTRIVYDELGNKIKEVTPRLYDSNLEDTSTSNYLGDQGIGYDYYPNGLLSTVKDPENNVTSYSYDVYGNVETEIKPNGLVYIYEYDDRQRVIKVLYKEDIESSPIILEQNKYTIIDGNKLIQENKRYIDHNEVSYTYYTYDYAGKLIEKTNADNSKVSIHYYPNGMKSKETDEMGYSSYYEYDGLNRLKKEWIPFEEVEGKVKYTYIEYTYDNMGNKTKEIIAKEPVEKSVIPNNYKKQNFTYYKNGKLKSHYDNEGRKTDYEYDHDGNLSKEIKYKTEHNKIITEYQNNHFGKPLIKKQHVISGDIYGNEFTNTEDKILTTEYSYDKNGNLKSEKTADLNITEYGYDNVDRQIQVKTTALDEYGNESIILKEKVYNWEDKLLSESDGNGNITSYSYDKRGFVETITNALGGGISFTYDRAGRKTGETSLSNQNSFNNLIDGASQLYNKTPESDGWNPAFDLNNDKIIDIYDLVKISKSACTKREFIYDSMDRVKAVKQVYMNNEIFQSNSFISKAYKYDKKGNVLKELDAGGYEAGLGESIDEKIDTGYGMEYSYNAANKIVTTLDPVLKDKGNTFTVKYSYDALGRVLSETNAKGYITSYSYNNSDKVLIKSIKKSETASPIVVEANSYDLLDNNISKTDGNGNVITYEYNQLNKLKKVTYPSDESILENIVIYQYDEVGNLVFTEDSALKTDSYVYDGRGLLVKHTEAKSDGTEAITLIYKYDKNGNKRFETDGNGTVTEYCYDKLNRVTAKKVDSQNTSYDYDSEGNLISETDWRGNKTSYVYDKLNRLIEKRDYNNNLIEKLEYNNNGTQSKAYDALNNAVTFEYDKNRRLTKTIDQENNVEIQSYDEVGNIASKINGNNNETKYEYNELNKLVLVTNALEEKTIFQYDNNGNLTSQIDGNGNETIFQYNCINKVKKLINPAKEKSAINSIIGKTINLNTLKSEESYSYYADGKLKNKVDRNGIHSFYEYDIHGRMTIEKVGDIIISYSYDNNGNQLTITDGTGTTQRTYDFLNRVTSKTVPNIGQTTFTYDETEGLEPGCYGETTTDPKGNIVKKIYDGNYRLFKVIDKGKETTYTYYNNGNRESIIYPNGSKEEYNYYKNNTLKTLVNKKADGTVLDSYEYSYDGGKNITEKVDSKGTTSYTYDKLNRIKTVTEPTGKNTIYSYDNAGNRIKEGINQSDVETEEIRYYYDGINRLRFKAIVPSNISSTNIKYSEYTFDANGNQLKEEVTEISSNGLTIPLKTTINKYDKLNQVIETKVDEEVVIKNTYNGEGLRVEKEVQGNKTLYLYEGDKVILELNRDKTLLGRNVHGINLISRETEGQEAYYYYNGHGDVTKLLNYNGEVLGSYYYDAFGVLLEKTSSINNPYLYSEYQYDSETNTYYLLSRMYDPITARFLQEDTYRGNPKDPLSLNLYTYAHNNPIIYDDPNGHWIHIAVGALVGAAINTAITAYEDYKDDGQINSGWKAYAGSVAEGALVGAIGAATGGTSLLLTVTADTAAGFGGSLVRQYITKGKVSLKNASVEAVLNGAGGVATHFGGKLVSKGISKIKNVNSVQRVKGIVLNTSSKQLDNITKLKSNLKTTVSDLVERTNIAPRQQLAFAGTSGNYTSHSFESALDYADDKVMANYKKVVSEGTGKAGNWVDDAGNIIWPKNDGFAGIPEKVTLKPGTVIDRYGYEGGTFVSPKGVPYEMRALAPGTEIKPYHVYEVVKPVDGLGGEIAPWFNQPGGGTQYKLYQSIQELLDGGFVKEVFK